MADNTIILNASSSPLSPTDPGVYISSIASTTDNTLHTLVYNSTTSQLNYNTGKTFIIDHPIDQNKHLVHACLEGPEAGVYYRGKGEINNNESVEIDLPSYVSAFARDFTVQITAIYDGKVKVYNVSEVENNKFTVYGENGRFNWLVHALRGEVVVEPNKDEVDVKGSGPYLWI